MDFPFGDRNTRLLSTDIRESHSRRCRVLNELLLNYTAATACGLRPGRKADRTGTERPSGVSNLLRHEREYTAVEARTPHTPPGTYGDGFELRPEDLDK